MGWLLSLIGIMAVCSILFGSLKALQYDTYNKILAYSSIGQIGYIAMGFAIGNFYGLVGAVLHIVGHGFMKAGLFYTSGALKYKYDIHDIRLLGQIYRQMPITSAAMTVCMLSMIGLPPFTGFFSKWYLALGAVQRGQYFYVAVLLFSSLLSAVYFFRIMESIFMGAKTESFSCHKERFELPWQMLLPLVGVVTVVIGLGLFNSYFVDSVLAENLTEVFL